MDFAQASVEHVNNPAGGGSISAGGNGSEERQASSDNTKFVVGCMRESESVENGSLGQADKNRKEKDYLPFFNLWKSLHNVILTLDSYVC